MKYQSPQFKRSTFYSIFLFLSRFLKALQLRNIHYKLLLNILVFLFFTSSVMGQQSVETVTLNFQSVKSTLLTAPMEKIGGSNGPGVLIPLQTQEADYMLEVWNSPIMSPEFQILYPDIKTFVFQDVNNPATTGRMTMSADFINIFLLSPTGGMVIAPSDVKKPFNYVVKQEEADNAQRIDQGNRCGYEEEKTQEDISVENEIRKIMRNSGQSRNSTSNGATLRTYNFAVVCTAEFHDGNGGTIPLATIAATTSINNMQAFYDRDLAVRFNLLTPIVYTDTATDPFVPDNAGGCSRTVQAANAIAANFTSGQYDLGHALHQHSSGDNWSSGGLAGTGPCLNSVIGNSCTQGGSGNHVPNIGLNKSRGWSGLSNNTTNIWYGLLAHEVGHMFGASHTFNGIGSNCNSGNISTDNSYEIASGTTIMSYRGICQADNNVPAPLPANNYFHTHSISQMLTYIDAFGTCSATASTGNTPPVADANFCSGTYTLPPGTPFTLCGSGTDADGDNLTYNWEQYDEDGTGTPTQGFIGATAGASAIAPLFRNYPPTSSPNRTFPRILDIANGTSNPFEVLPTVTRSLNFRLTVRDNNSNGGGIHCSPLAVAVDASLGAFSVSTPNGGETWTAGINETVTWTNNTSSICANVSIKLSIDGGVSYPYDLGSHTNDGSATITVPTSVANSSTARIKVECGDACFKYFDISDTDFSITSTCNTAGSNICPTDACTFDHGDVGLNLALTNTYGSVISSYTVNIDGTETSVPRAIASVQGGSTCTTSGTRAYEMFDISVSTTGAYTLGVTSAGFTVASLFPSAGFDVNNPCNSTFFGSSGYLFDGGAFTNYTLNTVMDLVACTSYKVILYASSSGYGDNTIDFSGPGDVYLNGAGPAGSYNYTYVAVNKTTSLISAVSATSNFTTLAAGTYDVYGASYYSGAGPTPPSVNTATWSGQTIAAVQNTDCALFSANNKFLTINGACATTSTFTAPADLCINAGVQTGLSGGLPVPGGGETGVYSGSGVTDDSNGMTYSFDPAAGVGVQTITYTFNDGVDCINITATDDVEVFALPTCAASNNGPICDGEDVTLDETGGDAISWAWSSDGSAIYDDATAQSPVASGAVNGEIFTVVITDANGCTSSCMTIVTVNENPMYTSIDIDCTGSTLNSVTVNATIGSGTLEYNIDGGTYQASNVFTPPAVQAGMTYTFGIRETTTLCSTDSGLQMITCNCPTISGNTITADETICDGDAATVLDGAAASTSNASPFTYQWQFSPAGTNTFTDIGGATMEDYDPSMPSASTDYRRVVLTSVCPDDLSNVITVTVNALPTCAASNNGPICGGSDVTLNETGGDAISWLWSSDGSATFDDATAQSPVASGAVDGEIFTVVITDANGCTSSCTTTVKVDMVPPVIVCPPDFTIELGDPEDPANTGGFATATDNCDPNPVITRADNVIVTGTCPIVKIIERTWTAVDLCTNTSSCLQIISVIDQPIVTFTAPADLCIDSGVQAGLGGGIPTGGIYSGLGVTDNGDDTYDFDPAAAGTVTITYTFTDVNGCSSSAMSDIDIFECGFNIVDPCACLDNATIFDCNDNSGGDDGQFSEKVTIIGLAGGALPSGQSWTVIGATGAWDAFNVPAIGVQSAGVLILGDGSVLLAFNAGIYEIDFVHVDDIGYSLTIEGPFAMGDPANVTFTISNKCEYPDPVFDPAIPTTINTTDPIIILGATDTNGGTEDGVTFTLDGGAATMIDPAALTLGFHTVVMTYDGAADGNGGVSPDGGITPATPGCVQEVQKIFELIDCELIIDCSNVVDQTIACRADLPPTDMTLPIAIDSCGNISRSVFTNIPGNTGCPNDTLFITRTYTLEDAVGNIDSCVQIFTVISTMDPTFTSFPADTTVLCGAATDPAATGMAEGAGECNPATPLAVVTFNDAITPGACPAEMTITRTWTVTDRCGRAVDMDQTIMVVDTIAPTMVCQPITLQLDANGMATATTDAVNNGSSDNCGGPITFSLTMTAFTCDNTGPNDVWLIGEDECGNIDSCMAVVTIEDNIPPTITCPGDIVMPNDLGVCGAIVDFDVIADDNCGFAVTQTEGIPSGGFYPVGETMNCFTVTDDSGLTAECCFTVTINDEEGPVIECPNDLTIQLESGECEEVLYYDIPFMDNCGTIDAEMSQAVNEALVSTALDCQFNTSNHLRYFTNTLSVPVEITQVNFGIFNSGITETVTVNIYAIMPGAAFVYANMILMGTTDHAVPAGMNQVILTAAVEATIPVGMDYVLELKANNTTNFVIGYNTSGETESTYISGNPPLPCVSLEPTDIDLVGPFANFAVILYSNAEGGPYIEQTGGLPSGSYFPMGTTTNTFIATDVYGNETICEFDVTVNEFENGVTGTMACNDDVNISMDENCEVQLLADMILEGNVYGCFDDYILEISGVTGTIITEPGTYTVTVTDPDTGNSCWSTITVEGKAIPTIDCSVALCPLDVLEGEWTAEDNTFSPGAAWAFDGGAPNNNILYDVIEFVVDVSGTYTLTMTPSDEFDGIAGIYENSFDPDMPGINLIGGDDDVPGIFESEPDFMIDLEAGTTYFLVSSTWGAGQMGIYTWTFSGPGDLLSACEVKCYELDALLSGDLEIPAPTVFSCVPYTLSYSDSVDNSDCGTTTVTRTYVAQSANGAAICEVTFEIDPLSVSLDVDLPVQLVELTCNDGTDPDEIVAIFDNPLTVDDPNTDIIENNEGYVYGYPTYTVNGHPQKIDNNACNVFTTYGDQEIVACAEGCNGNRKVLRTWTILDWCTQETTSYVQTIKAVDTEAPTLGTQDITLSTDPWGCSVDFDVPAPWELHDNCDSNPKYSVSGPAGVLIIGSMETGYTALGTPKGVHTFYYVAYDCCDNEESYPFQVTVIDATPPVVAVVQNIVISLTSGGSSSGDGLAKLYAQSVDNGSHDGCSDVKLEVRREDDICDIIGNTTYNADGHPQDGSPNPNSPSYDPDGGAYVKFCCDDISNATVDVNGDGELDAGYVKVWLRVWDDGDMDGVYGTDGDNYNEAWAFVKVEDKLAPTIQCPPDVTLTCDMDYTDLNMTGSANGYGSCGTAEVEYNDIIINLNTCNEGFIRRRWNIVGRSDLFCDQTITMEAIDQPVNVSFSQVGDFTASNCPDEISLGQPTWVAGPCDVLGYTIETDTFKFEDGACYKLVNYWTVINWCDYEPNNPFWDGEGLWEHVQVIKVTDETKPVIEDCDDRMFAINDHSDSDNDGEVCEAKITLTNVATDPGSENCPTGWLKWQVFIDLWGDGTDDLEFSSHLPSFDTQFNDTNGNGIPDVYVSPTASGGEISIPLPDIAGSMSNHKVRWKVTDGCNNVTTCDYEFMVVDKKAPTPYCVSLSTALMDMGDDNIPNVELWAVDFNVGSFDNCTNQENLRYTFTDVAPEDDPLYDPANRSSYRTFDCIDVMNSPLEVQMYVWDEKNNSDFCVVSLTLIDNTGNCDGDNSKAIGGTIETYNGNPVAGVETTLDANLTEYPRTQTTDENGHYAFYTNPINVDYQISASKDIDYLNGVSTLDLVKIQRHILGIESLDSPYKLIAADVNADYYVKASDLTELRKLILGVFTDLPNNESWRFVDEAQTMTMTTSLEDVDYLIDIDNLQVDMMSSDLVAVKIGDVTDNAVTNLSNQSAVVRSNKKIEFSIYDQEVVKGETVEVAFTSENFEEVYGYQFTLELTGLEFESVQSGAVAMIDGNVGVLSNEIVTVSYNDSEARTIGKQEAAFSITFVATQNGKISNMIDITSKVTQAEAYVGNTYEIRDVIIRTRGNVTKAESSELFQNEPNPFKGYTVIGFNLSKSAQATLTLTDVTGKVIIRKEIDGIKGYNTVNLTANQLGVSGLLYYTLESGEYTATKKMIVID